jgi:hypothetical protein
MKTYEIKITGMGTAQQLSHALRILAKEIGTDVEADVNLNTTGQIVWEDSTLCTTITEQ